MRRVSVPQGLLVASALAYGATFAALLEFGRPGLGISGCFYVAVILAAAATDPGIGTLAGLGALFLYELAIHHGGGLALRDFTGAPALTRLGGYTVAGALTGFLALRGRRMLAQSLYVLEDLVDLAHVRIDEERDRTDAAR